MDKKSMIVKTAIIGIIFLMIGTSTGTSIIAHSKSAVKTSPLQTETSSLERYTQLQENNDILSDQTTQNIQSTPAADTEPISITNEKVSTDDISTSVAVSTQSSIVTKLQSPDTPEETQQKTEIQTPDQGGMNTLDGGKNGENHPPNAPGAIYGPAVKEPGELCAYVTSTTDPDGDQVWYKWDWGNEVSDWIGPYASGVDAGGLHTWNTEGYYNLRVKAKDTHDAESDWSQPLVVHIRILRGDMNIDGCINLCDVNPWVEAISWPDQYRAHYHADPLRGDINQDGVLDFGDINPFRDLLFYHCGCE